VDIKALQHGLEWLQTPFHLTPTWTLEPSVDMATEVAMKALQSSACKASLEFQGAFNKLYSFTSNDISYLMRISLPVHPNFKTSSEFATLTLLRKITKIPMSKVITYYASPDNKIGFEWMLMERVVEAHPLWTD